MQTKPKPPWLKIKPPNTHKFHEIRQNLRDLNLHTVCEEAHCPNMSECWSGGTATLMVLGDTCTRACKFCAVASGNPKGVVIPEEPMNVGKAVAQWGLDYVVLTAVDRDDIPDGGASHFAACIREIKNRRPETLVEVLTSDFKGDFNAVETVMNEKPDVFAHNIETVRSLQKTARDLRANYDQSLSVIKHAKEYAGGYTKSSIMVGIGETESEIIETMRDLRSIDVDFLTIGQYLRPSDWHLPVSEYVTPEQFKKYEELGLAEGFKYVAAGPFVRSSYKAGEFFIKSLINKEKEGVDNAC